MYIDNENCILKRPQIYGNIANVNKNVYEFINYKEDLIKFLNLNPLISYSSFKKYEIENELKENLIINSKKKIK